MANRSQKSSGAGVFKGTHVPLKALFENLEDGAPAPLRRFQADRVLLPVRAALPPSLRLIRKRPLP